MPVDPGPPAWTIPDPSALPAGQELVAVGADLSPSMLLAGYRRGIFPMPEGGVLGWWSPDPRGVLRPAAVHVSRSLRRSLGRFTVSVDRAFASVVTACADPARPHGWITPEYEAAYRFLHALGWAHSIEVWDAGGSLAGGLFGVEVGGLFAAESKFHARADASKVAVVALADLLSADGGAGRVIDVQWRTDHLTRLGVVDVARDEYLGILLPGALACSPVLASGQAPPVGGAASASRIRWRIT